MIQQQRKDYILLYRQLRDQVKCLENKPDVPASENGESLLFHSKGIFFINKNIAGSRSIQRTDHIEQRTLARSRLSYDGNKFPLWYGETDIF